MFRAINQIRSENMGRVCILYDDTILTGQVFHFDSLYCINCLVNKLPSWCYAVEERPFLAFMKNKDTHRVLKCSQFSLYCYNYNCCISPPLRFNIALIYKINGRLI